MAFEATNYAPARLWAYAVGSVGSGVFATVPSVILLYYLTETLHILPAIAGLIIVIPKILGIVIDPLVGTGSDAIRTPFGQRRPFVLLGAVVMTFAFVGLFNPPSLSEASAPIYAFTLYLVLSLGYSLFAVPYITVFGELAGSEAFRARLIGRRMIFLFIGTLLGAAAPPLLVGILGDGAVGYGRMALVVGAISGVSMAAAGWSMSELETVRKDNAGRTRQPKLWEPLRNPRFRRLLCCYLFLMVASSAITSALPYFVTQALRRPVSDVGLYLATGLALATLASSLWSRLIEKFGAPNALLLATALSICSVIAIAFALEHDAAFYLSATLFGLATAGVQVAAFVLLAEQSADQPAPAIYTGIWTSAEKLGLALGPLAVGLILGTARHSTSGPAIQSAAAPYLLAAICVVPICLTIFAAAIMKRAFKS